MICLTPNDPWSLSEWATRLDPEGRMRFLSDGNLEFGRAAGLTLRLPELFLGECYQRFLMIVNGSTVERVSVERSPMELEPTRPDWDLSL